MNKLPERYLVKTDNQKETQEVINILYKQIGMNPFPASYWKYVIMGQDHPKFKVNIYHEIPDYYLSLPVIPFDTFIKLVMIEDVSLPSKENILKAYNENNSIEVKKVLKDLFPKVFEEDKYFDKLRLESILSTIKIRNCDNLKNKGFYLHPNFNWEVIEDDLGVLVLIPTKLDKQ